MNEVILLFAVIAVLYLWECACWLSDSSITCVTWLGKHWRLVRPGKFLGNHNGGFVFAHPLPPLGSIIVGNHFPLSLSPDGISNCPIEFPRSQPNPRFISFNEIKSIKAAKRKVTIDGVPALRSPSVTLNIHFAAEFIRLKDLPTSQRAARIEELLKTTFDTPALETLWAQLRKHLRKLRLAANGLFILVFVLAPLAIINFGIVATWVPIIIALFAFTGPIAWLFYRAHKQFFPAADDDRFTHVIILLLAPASAMRAHDLLSRRLLETFHPLALARVFCSKEQFTELAAKTLRNLRFSLRPHYSANETGLKQADDFSHQVLLRLMEKFLKQNKIAPEDIYRAPQPQDETCRSYCPRCQTQFTTSSGECTDCGGVPQVPFTAVATGKTGKAHS